MKVYIVEVHYDYETHDVYGVYSNKKKAKQVAEGLREEDDILDGVFVSEYEVTR